MVAYSARVIQILIIISMSVTMYMADEKQLDNANVEDSSGRQGCIAAFSDLFKSLKNLPPSMFKVLAVTAITWVMLRARAFTTSLNHAPHPSRTD